MSYLKIVCKVFGLAAVCGSLVPVSLPARAQSTVPAAIQPPPGNEEVLRANAAGTQNYICMPGGWTFIGPQATLTVKIGNVRTQVATHYLSPNPDEYGTPRPTWQSSLDSSAVWAKAIATSIDSAEPGAIPWLLLEVVGSAKGSAGAAALSSTTYIQRINTKGGAAPVTSCIAGMREFVPYVAEYIFYQKTAN
jgi:hypothetical protein